MDKLKKYIEQNRPRKRLKNKIFTLSGAAFGSIAMLLFLWADVTHPQNSPNSEIRNAYAMYVMLNHLNNLPNPTQQQLITTLILQHELANNPYSRQKWGQALSFSCAHGGASGTPSPTPPAGGININASGTRFRPA